MSDPQREAMLARRTEVMAAHPEITAAAELAPLMGDLQRAYWRWQIESHVAEKEAEEQQ